MEVNKLIDHHNTELKKKLIPEPGEPIEGNSFVNPNNEVFLKPIEK